MGFEQFYDVYNHKLKRTYLDPLETKEADSVGPQKIGKTTINRIAVLKEWLIEIKFNQENYMELTRDEIWFKLHEKDCEQFKENRNGIDEFFKHQYYFNFPTGRNKDLIPLN